MQDSRRKIGRKRDHEHLKAPQLTKQLTYSDDEHDGKKLKKHLLKDGDKTLAEESVGESGAAQMSFSVDFSSLAMNMGVKGHKSKKK